MHSTSPCNYGIAFGPLEEGFKALGSESLDLSLDLAPASTKISQGSSESRAVHPLTNQESLIKNIRFLKGDVFGKLAYPLPRCQDLPQEYFGIPEVDDVVVAVSHGWRNQSHPDPLGKKQNYLTVLLNALIGAMKGQNVYLFVDFLSLTQRPFEVGQENRSAEEDSNFAEALKCMHNVYFYADFIIHLPWEDYTIDGEENDYVVEASELLSTHCQQIGAWVQVVRWPTSDSKLPRAFDRIISVQGMEGTETVSSLEDLQSFIEKNAKGEVRLRRYPFGKINTIPTDERGWIFLERFITMVKCAMLEPAQAQKIVITSSEDISNIIYDGADRLRQAVQCDTEACSKRNSAARKKSMSNLDKVLNEFLVELSTKRFSSVSFEKLEDAVATSADEEIVKTIMKEFVTYLKEHWHKEVARQRNRLGKFSAAVLNYMVEWNAFSPDYMNELRVASTTDPTPVIILSLVTFALPLFVLLVPIESPDESLYIQFQFMFTTFPYCVFVSLSMLAACWTGLLKNSFGSRVLLWIVTLTLIAMGNFFGLAAIFDDFPIPFVQCLISLSVMPFLPALWWCAPAAQRAESGFLKRALCAASTIFCFTVAFGVVSPMLNAAMKHVDMWFQALLLACYLIIKLAFVQLGEVMSSWLGADTMPIFVFYSTYAYEYNLCQALAGGFDPLHFCELLMFDCIENAYHLWSVHRQGLATAHGVDLQQHHGKATYIVTAMLLRELCEILVPVQFLLQFVLMRKVQPKLNHSVCVTEEEFTKAVFYLCLDIGIEVLVGIVSLVLLRRAGFEPLKMTRGLVAVSLPVYILAAGGLAVYLICFQHSHSGADTTFQFLWLGDAQWECGLIWIEE